MELIKCVNGHYYDTKKYDSCPYCQKRETENSILQQKLGNVPVFRAAPGSINEDVTVAMMPGDPEVTVSGKQGGISAGIGADEDPVTVGFFSPSTGTACITGWLVCVEGPARGRDYRIFHGMNWVGRDPDMDIHMIEDKRIAPRKHCAVVYDRKSAKFFVVDGEVDLTYLNGELLKGSAKLKTGDVISIGESRFEFIPFCREGHQWE